MSELTMIGTYPVSGIDDFYELLESSMGTEAVIFLQEYLEEKEDDMEDMTLAMKQYRSALGKTQKVLQKLRRPMIRLRKAAKSAEIRDAVDDIDSILAEA